MVKEHTADFIIQAQGKTLEELFSETMRGMFETIKPEIASEEIIKRKFEIESIDLKTLLVDFLSEALYQSDVNNETYFNATFQELTETKLKVILYGKKIKSFAQEIKAVTHHGLRIEKKNEEWEAEVLFDI